MPRKKVTETAAEGFCKHYECFLDESDNWWKIRRIGNPGYVLKNDTGHIAYRTQKQCEGAMRRYPYL